MERQLHFAKAECSSNEKYKSLLAAFELSLNFSLVAYSAKEYNATREVKLFLNFALFRFVFAEITSDPTTVSDKVTLQMISSGHHIVDF